MSVAPDQLRPWLGTPLLGEHSKSHGEGETPAIFLGGRFSRLYGRLLRCILTCVISGRFWVQNPLFRTRCVSKRVRPAGLFTPLAQF